ncbi:putative phage abortive infection protein [uncultured Tenacibaculum sp.]|uniref:putative phage abortive infection protein n=1 Tax=uncultured Tenacibaculum sp. TaxID=174713 RepID=UPI00260DF39B|nr:putative phage abortive infection protein [uncultured Tenacibaculum sp.]
MIQYLIFKFRKTKEKYGLFGISLLIISVISIIVGIYISYVFFSKISTSVRLIENGEKINEQLTGVIGDFVGGIVGTIWSFAGVILFFLALRLQSRELSLQLEELKDTKEVFQSQQFENTFFNLLKNHNEIRLNTEIKHKSFNSSTQSNETTYTRGNAAFEEIKDFFIKEKSNLEDNFKKAEKSINETTEDKYWTKEISEKFLEKFEKHYTTPYDKLKHNPELNSKVVFKLTYSKFNSQLSHYFRNIYHILLYIKENEESELSSILVSEMRGKKIGIYINKENVEVSRIKNKYKKYSQFLQAQMSNTELLLLFYNALFFPKAKKLVQYYDLIENLNIDDLLYPEVDIEYYDQYQDNFELIPKSSLKSKDEIMEI